MKKLLFASMLCLALLLTACAAGPQPAATAVPAAAQSGAAQETAVTARPDTDIAVQQASLIELLDWIRDYVTIGTAGSSLRAAGAAAELLDWAVGCTLTEEEIAAAYADWTPAQRPDFPLDFSEQLGAVDYTVQMLTGDDSEEAVLLLSDAGCEDSGYPWDDHAVQVTDALMRAAGVR